MTTRRDDRDLVDAVVQIAGAGEREFCGTGFVVRLEGQQAWVVTCAHVVRGVQGLFVNDPRFEPEVELIACGTEEQADLAVIRANLKGSQQLQPLRVRFGALREGKCQIIGFSSLIPEKGLRRMESLKASFHKPALLQTKRGRRISAWKLKLTDPDELLEPGFSGSPVYSSDENAIVAVITMELNRGAKGYAIDLEELKTVWGDTAGCEWTAPPQDRLDEPRNICLGHLPGGSEHFVGREPELARLDAAWNDPRVHIISIVAWGGAGKSSLVDRWLARMEREQFRGAEFVFGWSFSDQGDDQHEDAADVFIDAALRECGEPEWAVGTTADKAVRLTELLRHHRILLVLDGLESIQSPPGNPIPGELKDPVLRTMLRDLQAKNMGLCVITTRVAVSNLISWRDTTAPVLDLPNLNSKSGADLLRHLGVRGNEEELSRASDEFAGHALALTLLGTFLRDACEGNVARRQEVLLVDAGSQAERVLKSYESWFQTDGRLIQLTILRLLGLFNRPARPQELAALRQKPAIDGLTTDVDGIGEAEWNRGVASLRQASLISPGKTGDVATLDAHPLIREYFARSLRSSNKSAWSEGHTRLFDFLANSVKSMPTTIDEISTLHSAIAHGCYAGRYEAALELYWKRILQKKQFYSVKVLGALASDTAALFCFFEGSWDMPSKHLSSKGRSLVLDQAGEALHALGWLDEARKPMELLYRESRKRGDLRGIATSTITLCELYLTMGSPKEAHEFANESIRYANRCKSAFYQMVSRSNLGDVLHQAGRFDEAEASFIEAEAIQRQRRPERPLLSSMQGFAFCDLLISRGRATEAAHRANETIKWARDASSLLAEALDHLTLGRVLCITGSQGAAADFAVAEKELESALNLLKRAGAEFRIPRALLACAEMKYLTGQPVQARALLNDALELATSSRMGLVEADCHLRLGQVSLALGDASEARQHCAAASSFISLKGYLRRVPELDQLKRLLGCSD